MRKKYIVKCFVLISLLFMNVTILSSCNKNILDKEEGYAYKGEITDNDAYDKINFQVEFLLNKNGTYESNYQVSYISNDETTNSASYTRTLKLKREKFEITDEKKDTYSYIDESTLKLEDIDYIYYLKDATLLKDEETNKCVFKFEYNQISKVLELDYYDVVVYDKNFYKHNKLYVREDYSEDNIVKTYKSDNCHFILNDTNKITKIRSYILTDDVYDCEISHNGIMLLKDNKYLESAFFHNKDNKLVLVHENKRETYVEINKEFTLDYFTFLPSNNNIH